MTLPPPLTLSFWFQPSPPPFLPVTNVVILALCSLFIVAGVVVALMQLRPKTDKLMRQLFRRAASLLIVIGAVGLLLYACSYEEISYFSMRFWWLVLLGALIAWAVPIVRFATRDIPAIRAQISEKEKYEKWLPKKKK
jgi:hypothetical protein